MPSWSKIHELFRESPGTMLTIMPEPANMVMWFAYALAVTSGSPTAALPVYEYLRRINPEVNFDQAPADYRYSPAWMRVFVPDELEQTLARAELAGEIPELFITTVDLHDPRIFRLYFGTVQQLREHDTAFGGLVRSSAFAPLHLAHHLEAIVAVPDGAEWFKALTLHLRQLLATKCLSPVLLSLCGRLTRTAVVTSVVERPPAEQVAWFHALAPAPDFLPIIKIVNLTPAVNEFFISYMRAHIKVFATPDARKLALEAYDRPPRHEEPYSVLRTHARHDAAKYLWVMAVGLSDGYLTLKTKSISIQVRFWRALQRLPPDLQQLLILRTTGSRRDVIPANTITRGHWRSIAV